MDDTDARSLINAEFIVNQIVGADDEVRQRLIEDLAGAFAASTRSYDQQDINQSKVLRVLQAGSPVTTDTSGATKDLSNKSLFKTLDFRTQTLQIDASNHEIIRILGGSGADCLFDYLVSSCFASLTGFTEGQSFTSLSGCTFKGYSTLSLMQTAVQTAAAPATVAICGGTYAETWTINGTALNGLRVSYFGASSAKVLITALTFTSGGFGDSKGLLIREVNITGTTDLSGADSTWLEDCVFNIVSLPAGQTIRDVHFKSCDIASITGGSGNQWSTCSFENCYIAGNMIFSTGSSTLGPMRIESCQVSGGIDQGSGGTGTDIQIIGNSVGGTVNSGANCIRITNCSGLVISGNEIGASPTGASIQLREQNGRDWGFAITGNRFAANANGYLGTSSATSEVRQGIFAGNNFATAGGASTKAIHATADFGYVTFGPNGPDCMDYSSVVSDSGVSTNVFYTSCTVPTGATHPMYGTGTSSTGAAANEPFVTIGNTAGLSAERALTPVSAYTAVGGVGAIDAGGNSTVTLTLKDLTAGWTQAGVFDISTAGNLIVLKHMAVGANAGGIDANTILTFAETFTDPASPIAGIQGSPTKTMTSANAIDVIGAAGNASVSGAFADTGIVAGVSSTVKRLTNNAGSTSADFRNYDALANFFSAASATLTARYGFYARDMTGNGTLTTQYGFYVPALAKGGTNWAFYSVSAPSFFGGANTLGPVSAPSTPAATNLVEYNQTGTQFLKVKDASGNVYNETHLHLLPAQVDVTVASTTVPYQVVGPMPQAGVITNVYAKLGENKTNGATSSIFDIHLITAANQDTDGQGTTVYTTQANRPTIANTHMATTATAPDVTSFAAGDWFAIYTDAAGTNATVATVSIALRYT